MITFRGDNVEEVFQIAVMSLREPYNMVKIPSRNGDVLMFRDPVCSTYNFPRERVMFLPERNCNPFFHFIEGLWMLAGRRDVEPLARFVKRMKEFSDDGNFLYGSYGYRWRNQFGYDQLYDVIQKLKDNKWDRRIVLSMWDPIHDLKYKGKDVPCNTQIYFKAYPTKELGEENNQIKLDMTVCCRSNDLIWGAYGANAVHFSMLHEYIATMSGLSVGCYHQISNNAHVYLDVWNELDKKLSKGIVPHGYETDPDMTWLDLVQDKQNFDKDLNYFFNLFCSSKNNEELGGMWITPDHFSNMNTFAYTAIPLVEAWNYYKQKDYKNAILQASTIKAPDWKRACVEWLQRKEERSKNV